MLDSAAMVPCGAGRGWQNVKQNLQLYRVSPWRVLKSCWFHTPFDLKISPYFNGVVPFFLGNIGDSPRGSGSLQFAVCDGHGFRSKHLQVRRCTLHPWNHKMNCVLVGVPSYSILDSRDPKEIFAQGLIWLLGFPIFFLLRLSPILPSRELRDIPL